MSVNDYKKALSKSRSNSAYLLNSKAPHAIRSKLNCQPLMAKLSIEGERLKIKIGEKHGVKLSSLAVSEGQYTPWTLFRVSELGTDYTMLEPLDSAKDFRQMIGLKIKFLEEM